MNLLDAACAMNWISPAWQFVNMGLRGQAAMNVWMPGSGMTGRELTKLLREHGIKVGGGGFVHGDYVCITVDDEELAQDILDWYGIGEGKEPSWDVPYEQRIVYVAAPAECPYCGTGLTGRGKCPSCGGPRYG